MKRSRQTDMITDIGIFKNEITLFPVLPSNTYFLATFKILFDLPVMIVLGKKLLKVRSRKVFRTS